MGAPYPADTRAKGWRFELDYEQIEQSSTWALAGPDVRPWLLMMWLTAWRQVPCGSLPKDTDVIAAQIGMTPKLWVRYQAVMLRGWFDGDDGRLYHPTLIKRVEEMMSRRRSDSDRKARERMRKADGQPTESDGVTPESRVTHGGLHPESSTDNRQPITDNQRNTHTEVISAQARESGLPAIALLAFSAMRRCLISDGHAGHPMLLALVQAGATVPEFESAATEAVNRGKGFAYAIGTLRRQRERAAATLEAMHKGEMPAVETPAQRSAREQVEAFTGGRVSAKRPSAERTEFIDV